MDINYKGEYWLRDGFAIPSLWSFVKETKGKLAKPLQVPGYATSGERQRLDAVSKVFEKDIYAQRNVFGKIIKSINENITDVRPIPHEKNPELYELAMFATHRLCNSDPLIYLYKAKNNGRVYQASAVDYLNKSYIYVSEEFFTVKKILSSEEVLFLIGHELGHTQCHHSTLGLITKKTNFKDEYSADRAGMIACGLWVKEKNPDISFEELGKICMRSCFSTLEKIRFGYTALSKNVPVDWNSFDYDELYEKLEATLYSSSRLSVDSNTHPSSEHRLVAASYFAESEMFCEYMGFDPAKYNNLLNTEQLYKHICQL